MSFGRSHNTTDNDLVFYMSNIIPQAPDNNQGVWEDFEAYCRALAQSGNELLIVCGPSGFAGSRIQPSGIVAIPDYTWKIAVVVPLGTGTALERMTAATRVIALRIPNSNSVSTVWQEYVTSANQIQNDTGFGFLTALPDSVASVLRSKVDGQPNPPPAITGFSPASGGANDRVIITGTNFDSATAVTFNGVNALFTVNSSAQITATVPANATSGSIGVTTTGGTGTSVASFMVINSTMVDLTISLTHSGNFFQGDTNDVYTITVINNGAVATMGAVRVADTLPVGLAATAIEGAGWTADLATLTCTRDDSLAAEASYPGITLTVSVATNAPASVINLATVSGGGDSSPGNNTTTDSTTIIPVDGAYTGLLVGWDVSGQSDYGASPLSSTTNAPRLTFTGLTRGSGVATSGTAAARAWGGVATFAVSVSPGYGLSCSSIGRFDYRRSTTGPTSGLLQYQVGSGAFVDIANLSYNVSSSSGASLGPIDLSVIAPLQKVASGTTITFRIVNFDGTSSQGTWYVFDVANTTAPDLTLNGTVAPAEPLPPIQRWRQQWFGTTNNAGNAADTFVSASDGMPNLLKYALGLNPLVAASNPVVGDVSSGYLRLTTPKNANATDISLSAIVSGDLRTWTTNGTVVDLNSSILQVHDDTPVIAGTNRFIRLRVSDP